MLGRLRSWRAETWVALALLLFPLAGSLHPAILQRIALFGEDATRLFIFAVLALGLNVVVGYAGLLHLGIAAFFGIGAYITGILIYPAYPFQWSYWIVLCLAPLGAGLAGVMLGAPTLRLRGDYLALVTLGFGEVVKFSLLNFKEITNGAEFLSSLPHPALPQWLETAIGWLGIQPDWLHDFRLYYYLCLFAMMLVYVALMRLEDSRWGRAFVAIREDELAAACTGINPVRVKLFAFALGAGIGLAGALYVAKVHSTDDPANVYNFPTSITVLSCLIFGGLGSLRGAVLGVFLLRGFEITVMPFIDDQMQTLNLPQTEFFQFKNWKYLIFGLTLILVIRFRPEGLFPSRRMKEELAGEVPSTAG